MATLTQWLDTIAAGGEGSGCHGANCGRPLSGSETEGLKQELTRVQERLKAKPGSDDYVPKKEKARLKILKEGLKRRIQYGKRREKLVEGLRWRKKKLSLKNPIEPVKRSKVAQKFKTQEGYDVTMVKPQKVQDREGQSWFNKVSPYKGSFIKTHDNFNATGEHERNVLFQAIKGHRGQAVQVSRNYGEKTVFVKEVSLMSHGGTHDNIVRTKEAKFNNFGKAFGFLKRKYGISFRLKERE